MIVEPYKCARPAPPSVALLLADANALAETGELLSLARLGEGVQVWASQDRVLDLLREGRGAALCWRGQPIRYEAERGQGFRVRVLGLAFPDEDRAALDGLRAWRDWLGEEGAAPQGSLGGSSMSLLRAKLEAVLYCTAPHEQAPPIRYTIGGRQELGPLGAPAIYEGSIRHVDLRAAYARTLAGLRYGGHWHEMRLDERRLRLFALEHPLFCRARVSLSGAALGPLVRRERKEPDGQLGSFACYPTSGQLQGVWTWQELEAARAGGASVRLLGAWGHASAGWQPFQPWWRAVEQGRESLPGFARALAKATGNALWGQFCIQPSGRRSLLKYQRVRGRLERRVILLDSRGGPRPAHDLSELLTGIVRAELYRMMLAAGPRLCSAHTDGGWIDDRQDCDRAGRELPRAVAGAADGRADDDVHDAGTSPALDTVASPSLCSALGGDWRVKASAERLRVLDPQMLAYRVPGEPEDRYVVAGWPARLAGEQFERLWSEAQGGVSAAA